MRPFSVGICLSEEALQPCPVPPQSPGTTPLFVSNIMHRAVAPYPFMANVQYDASAAALAAAFNLPEVHIQHTWLAPLQTKSASPASCESPTSYIKTPAFRFTPRSVFDVHCITADDQDRHMLPAAHSPRARANPDVADQPKDVARCQKACQRLGLRAMRFSSLFVEEEDVDVHVVHFAHDLVRRLHKLRREMRRQNLRRMRLVHAQSAGDNMTPITPISDDDHDNQLDDDDELDDLDCDSSGNDMDSESDANPDDCMHPAVPRDCGLSRERTHSDVHVVCEGQALRKVKSGLYRTAKSEGVACRQMSLGRGTAARTTYFEVVIVEDGGAGGLCIGVASDRLPLNRLVGSDDRSLGLHSSGSIVHQRGEFKPFGSAFGNGDRIGCAVSIDGSGDVCLSYLINGVFQGEVRESLFGGSFYNEGMLDDELFAAISLYKKGCKVVLLCCPDDWEIGHKELHSHFGTVHPICSSR